MEIFEYLKDNKISFNKINDSYFEIDNKIYYIVLPINGLLFDKSFKFCSDIELPDDCDYFVFYFGGIWYYTNSDKSDIELCKLKYLGKSVTDFYQSENFIGVHGGYEILNGSGNYEDWCKKAKFLGVKNLGICEKNTLAGIIKFQLSCKKYDIAPILGASYTVLIKGSDRIFDVKCFVKNEIGWNNLLMINKEVNVINNRFIYNDVFKKYIEGLLVVLDPKTLDYNDYKLNFNYDFEYFQLDTVEFLDLDKDRDYLDNLKRYINSGLNPLPITDAYYLDKEDYYVKELLNKISGVFEYKSNNQYFKDKDDYFYELSLLMKNDFRLCNYINILIKNESEFVSKCNNFKITIGNRYLPIYNMTNEERLKYNNNEDLFWGLILDGFNKLNISDKQKYLDRIEKEVSVIELGKIMDYFLMLHDIVSWCNKNDILVGVGRGSAGGSLISMLLGLIHLDPIEFDLLFERFINEGRVVKTLPDIDTDIEASKRDVVKKYMEDRFGKYQVVSVGTYTALQIKSSIKDLGRVFNLNFSDVNYITSRIDDNLKNIEDLFKNICSDSVLKIFANDNIELINTIPLILGQPKAKSIHACAMIIYPNDKDMFNWSPVILQDGEYVTEWEGPEMETVGFLKEDILGLLQLDKFKNILNLIEKSTGKSIDIYNLHFDDKKVYKYFCKGWNGDVFHFGSAGLTKYCKELLPENIDDLIAGISLYRPGAIENNFHNEYVLRKMGDKEVDYIVGTENILDKTYGVFVFQEQIMKLCQVLGGLSLVEADDVRKAMVKKKYEELTKYKDRFIDYYVNTFKVDLEYSKHVWDQIDKASEYLFNRCISGNETFKSLGVHYKYTIGQMWKLRNIKDYYKELRLTSDNYYNKNEYGFTYSLDKDGFLKKNKIKDIRFEGIKPIYRVTVDTGDYIDVTINHKFPTNNGEKILKDIRIGIDKIYYNIGYFNKKVDDVILGNGVLNSKKGIEGFIKKEHLSTEYLKLEFYKKNYKKEKCELCGNNHIRLEIHHKDNNHANNDIENLITVCPGCHKKEHYKIGRTKIGEKGLLTKLVDVLSIEYLKDDEVYDVEMEGPNHNFVTNNNIVTSNSHAAAYAITGYICQWLKVNYPLEYWVTAFEYMSEGDKNLNKVSYYISEIYKEGGIKVFSVDINHSENKIIPYQNAIYWSISSIKQIGGISSESIIKERNENGQYFSFEEFLIRNTQKGSKVNKTHIDNLILSGAFDDIENISRPCERLRLLKFFRDFKKMKIENNDVLIEANNFELDDWWWVLKQKKLSGISEFDFSDLCDRYISDSDYLWMDCKLLQDSPNDHDQYYGIGGYIVSVIERSSKNKGKYCSIYLDSNSEFVWVNIFPDQYKKLLDSGIEFVGSEGNLLLLTGLIRLDDFRKENVLKVWEYSQVVMLGN